MARLRALCAPRSTRVALVLAALAGIISCFFPLFDVHGVESAFALGLVLPFLAASAAAAHSRRHPDAAPTVALADAAILAALVWSIPVVLLALNQIRVRQCDPWGGFAFMVVGPGAGTQLAGLFGALAGRFAPRWAVRIALGIPLAGIGAGLYSFWSTPSIAVFSQFVGWFPGTLYDVGRSFPLELLTFRWLSICLWLVGAMLLIAFGGARRRPVPLVIALLASVAFGAGYEAGPSLGHRSTVPAIDDALGGLARGARCVVHYPREMRGDSVRRLVDDCDFSVERAERGLSVRQEEPVHAFFYRNAAEKQRWMGAGRTFIAKPWRMEVHLQLSVWPHPVLGHEIVHVVARNAAVGPFQVSGRAGGFWPNPGLIEGVAVGIDWPEIEGMTPHQWARAMRDLDLLPEVRRLMGLGFLGVEARRSYTTVGSFTRFFRDSRGVEALREAHRAGSVPDMNDAVADWMAHLDTVQLPEGAAELARMRFSRSSIFATVCPHRLATLRGELGLDLAAGDDGQARATCREMLAIDEGALDARVALVGVEARLGRPGRAREVLGGLVGAPQIAVARAEQLFADARWLHGRPGEARELYTRLLDVPLSEGERRLLEVKIDALGASPQQGRIVRAMFLDRGGNPASPVAITHLAHRLNALRDDGLGSYLAARQLIHEERFDQAIPMLEEASRRGLPTRRIANEASRLLARAHVALGRLERGAQLLERARADASISEAEFREWSARVAFLQRRPPQE